jgi:hypothetical protein
MRSRSALGATGALALAIAISVSGTALAGEATQNGVTQSFEVTVNPNKKLPKKAKKKTKPKGVSATIAVGVREATGQKPPSAQQVNLDLDKDLTITSKGLKQCNENTILPLNVDAARSACKKSIVGKGTATATCSANPNPDIPDVTVTAFNGTKQGKNSVILLHTVANLGGTEQIQILPAVLKKAKGKDYGVRAEIAVPPLAGGACSIVDFSVDLKKSYKTKGKKQNFVGAVCSDKTFDFASEFRYAPNDFGVSSLNPTAQQACKAKK